MSARVIRSDLEKSRHDCEAAGFLLIHFVNGINTDPGRPGDPLIEEDLIHIFLDPIWEKSPRDSDPRSDYERAIEHAYLQEWIDKVGDKMVLTDSGFTQFVTRDHLH